ncbi:MAG TPA: alpha/beta hydrolase [Caulobacteraceae bacterium]|jgi:pimeloyl-ACP methyl ester carboxylesterase|nr:alpha/beta hydrolase [Caulobacteraceae bacterium]
MKTWLTFGGAVLAGIVLVLIIAWIAMRRGDIPYAKLEAKYGGASSHYVDLLGGLHVHYRDQGNPKGPTVVLVHGFFVNVDTWKPWTKRLGNDYRIITLDLPGHGLTRAPDDYHPTLAGYVKTLDDFATAEHLGKFTLGGSSMGGDIAWRYASAHPEHLNGLILVDAAGWPDPRPQADRAQATKALQSPIGRFLATHLDATKHVHDALLLAYADPKFVSEEKVMKYTELNRAPGHRAAIVDLALDAGKEGYATPEKLAAIHVPTLILEGEKDQLVPPVSASRFAAAIPGSRLIVYPGLGHVIQEEDPDRTSSDVRAFLKSLQPAAKKVVAATSTKAANAGRNPNTTIFY